MAAKGYDAIVVGARCAGSPTAMLLARKGYKVLLVDRATFPSDTISTLLIHPPGVAALDRWSLLDRIASTGCPPLGTYDLNFGPARISGSPGTEDHPVAYAPRRTVLDKILVDAASEAGAEVREAFTVEDVVVEDGVVVGIRGHSKDGDTVTESARVVVGADGRHSRIAELVGAHRYNDSPPILCGYYTFWSGFPTRGAFEVFNGHERGWAVMPTNDDLTLVVAGWPIAEFEANKRDIEGNYLKMFEQVPEFAERIRGAKREDRFVGTNVENYFRKPFGPGWALVGDAGYNKDFITAQGISDALRHAESCSTALDEAFTGARSYEEALGGYQSKRDEHAMGIFELTKMIATLQPAPPEMQQLIGAMQGNQEAMDGFVKVQAGTISPAEFFAPENVGKIMAGAAA